MEPPIFNVRYELNPIPASRPRVTRYATYYGKKYTRFRQDMASMVHPVSELLECPLRAFVTFRVQIPQSRKKENLEGEFCTNNADIDNYLKAIFDSMNGKVFKDDRQVVSIAAKKIWSKVGSIDVELYEV